MLLYIFLFVLKLGSSTEFCLLSCVSAGPEEVQTLTNTCPAEALLYFLISSTRSFLQRWEKTAAAAQVLGHCPSSPVLTQGAVHCIITQAGTNSCGRMQEGCSSLQNKTWFHVQSCPSLLPSRAISSELGTLLVAFSKTYAEKCAWYISYQKEAIPKLTNFANRLCEYLQCSSMKCFFSV